MTEQKEKVVTGLGCCTQEDMCEHCPYVGQHQCGHLLKCDALFIIRKQEEIIEALENSRGTQNMNEHDATELAYKNGYKQGVADGVQKIVERLHKEFASLGAKDKFNKEFFLTKAEQNAKELIGGDSNA